MRIVSIVLCVLLSVAAVCQAGTVSYWQLDADNPTMAIDAVGNHDLLVVGNPAASNLKINPIPNPDTTTPWNGANDAATNPKATYFSSDAYYSPNTNDGDHDTTFDLKAGQSFTIEGWFRANNSGQIVTVRHGAGASHQKNGGYNGWAVYTTASGSSLTFYTDGASTNSSVVLSTPVVRNELTHFAGVYDASAGLNGETYLYVDGVLQDTGIVPGNWSANRGGSLAIGARDTGTGFNNSMLNGAVDEVRYSDEALLPSQFLNAVPEPATISMLLLGSLLSLRRRKK